MNTCHKLKQKPLTFRNLTGLSVAEFDKLLAELHTAWHHQWHQRQQRRARRRWPGAGHKPKLGLADRLLLTLIYYRTDVSKDFLGFQFPVDKGTARRIIQEIALLLTGIFRISNKKVRIEPDAIAQAFVDGTEKPMYRPKKRQWRSYSGKKKRHTVKHQIIVVPKKKAPGRKKQKRKVRIAAVSEAAEGKVHVKKLYDQSQVQLPADATGYGDSGYQGTNLKAPKKKPRQGKLGARAKKGESAVFPAADPGGTWDREDENLADCERPVSESAAATSSDDEDCRGPAQAHVCLERPGGVREDAFPSVTIAQRVYSTTTLIAPRLRPSEFADSRSVIRIEQIG